MLRKVKTILPFLFILFGFPGSLQCFAQIVEYSNINYDVKDGLAGSTVYSVTQDQDGFIWMATDNGLSRFDGKQFRNFTVQDGLPDNEILKVYADSKNRIWILPFKQNLCYYYRGKIHTQQNDTLLARLSFSDNPYHILEDKKGNLLITETRKYHIIYNDNKTESVDKLDNIPVLLGPAGFDDNGNFTLCAELYQSGFYGLIDPVAKKRIRPLNRYEANTRNKIILQPGLSVNPDEQGRYFVRSSNDTFLLNGMDRVQSIDYLSENLLAINGIAGVTILNLEERKSPPPTILQKYRINCSFRDREGNYWFATGENGVFMIPSFRFRNLSVVDNGNTLPVFSVAKWQGYLFAGTSGNGIWRFRPGEQQLQRISFVFSIPEKGRILSLQPVNEKILLAGGDAGLASNISLSEFANEPVSNDNRIVRKSSIKLITRIGTKVVIPTSTFTYMIDFSKKKFIHIFYGRGTSAVEADGGFYIGTLNGLMFLRPGIDTLYYGKQFQSLSSRIVQLQLSADNTLWVATKGYGVVALKNGKQVAVLRTTNGLSSDNCTALFIEPDGNTIWLGTDRGLNKIIRTDTGYTAALKYTMSDGLLSDVVYTVSVIDSTVYVGTPKGLSFFRPDQVASNTNCNLTITGVFVQNNYWAYDSTDFSLPHRLNDIRFTYAGISMKSGGDILYYYRLQGLHDDWRSTRENQLAFPTLPSGNYTLQLKAVNKYGVESPVREIRFRIEQLWWEKTSYRLLILGVLLLLVWLFIRMRIRYLRKRQRSKEELQQHIAELEQTALRTQMNPHFIFNSLNSIQQYVAERDITGANQFITDFSKLIRMTLDLSVHPLITLSEELLYIDTYLRLERTRLENQFDYEFSIDPAINTREYQLPPLILQPFVENSIRHGIKYLPDKSGLIRVVVTKIKDYIRISIEDNGVGREASKKYKTAYHVQYQSRGMSISTNRVELMNRSAGKPVHMHVLDLYSDTGEATGTRVNIDIPLTQNEDGYD